MTKKVCMYEMRQMSNKVDFMSSYCQRKENRYEILFGPIVWEVPDGPIQTDPVFIEINKSYMFYVYNKTQ